MIEPYTEEQLRHVERGLIFFCKHGSHAYGLNTPESDLDLRGIYIGPPEQVFGLNRTEQYDKFKFADVQIWELRKFIRLAAECNPNMVEILFVPDHAAIYSTPWMEMIQKIRNLFISKRAAGKFCGYADGQLKRMKGHKKWINNPQQEKEPQPRDFVRRIYDRDDARKYITELDKETYKGAHRAWKQYWNWKKNRNPERAVLEEKYGYDTKHAMHLIRLLRMGREILVDKDVFLDRSQLDKSHLMDIRNGKLTYEEIIQESEIIMEDIRLLKETSDLPKSADKKKIEQVMMTMYFSFWESASCGRGLVDVTIPFRKVDFKRLLEGGKK